MPVTGYGDSPERAGDPLPGTIVYYNHPGDATGLYVSKQSPAMVLNVHPDGTVDLRVFTQPTWRTITRQCECGQIYQEQQLLSAGGQIENFRLAEGEPGQPFTWCREYTPGTNPGNQTRFWPQPGAYQPTAGPPSTHIRPAEPRELGGGIPHFDGE